MSDPEQWPGTSPATGSATGPGATAPAAPTSSATRPAPDSARADSDVRYVAERLLAAVREDLGRADSKAAILLSGAMALVAVLFSARRGPVADAGAGSGVQVALMLVAGLLWAGGVVALVAVLMPRTRVAADLTFIREVTSGVSATELMPRLTESGEDVVRWTLDQSCALGAVLARKYRWLRVGICCLALGAISALFSEMW
ncbi:Pycsar system effector family protein [Streptomyces winkii]|uniref:Pycsar system effector family protein n=1 Tax=Streptomyces winkii TaxID=3051178 RepID=UPI0028D86061|nr:Pycsar system effector family protein [Streptomyces sp. DSM 40971]